jgi:hypothetical protein
MEKCLPDHTANSHCAVDDDPTVLCVPDEPVASITQRPAPLPITPQMKELFRTFKTLNDLPKEGLFPVIQDGERCPLHKKPYDVKAGAVLVTTKAKPATVYFTDQCGTADVYAVNCPEGHPDCQKKYTGEQHGFCCLSKRTIVSEWLFYDCLFKVSTAHG